MLTDRELQSQYTFLESREEINVSKLGKVSKGPVKTYEVYPSVRPGNTYKRLIAVDGVPLPPAELERNDRIHREDVLREAAKQQRESPQDRERRLRKEAKEQEEWNRTLDEVFDAYDIQLVGRETLNGHVTVIATLEPRPQHRPRTDTGKLMKKFACPPVDQRVRPSGGQGGGARDRRRDVRVGRDRTPAQRHRGGVRAHESQRRGLAARACPVQGDGPRPAVARSPSTAVTRVSDYKKFNVSTEQELTASVSRLRTPGSRLQQAPGVRSGSGTQAPASRASQPDP